jgi:hypothetical protein
VAAAAGKQNDGNDDQPKGAVIKQIAKTVIHSRSSIKSIGKPEGAPLLSYYDERRKRCKKIRAFCRFLTEFFDFCII